MRFPVTRAFRLIPVVARRYPRTLPLGRRVRTRAFNTFNRDALYDVTLKMSHGLERGPCTARPRNPGPPSLMRRPKPTATPDVEFTTTRAKSRQTYQALLPPRAATAYPFGSTLKHDVRVLIFLRIKNQGRDRSTIARKISQGRTRRSEATERNWPRLSEGRESFISRLIRNKELYVELSATIHEPFKNDEERYALPFSPVAFLFSLLQRRRIEENIPCLTRSKLFRFEERRRVEGSSKIRLFFARLSFQRRSVGATISRILLVALDTDRARVPLPSSVRGISRKKTRRTDEEGRVGDEERKEFLTKRRLSNKMLPSKVDRESPDKSTPSRRTANLCR